MKISAQIPREPINDHLLRIDPGSKEDLLFEISQILGSNQYEVINTHNTGSTIFVYNNGTQRHLLKAEFGQHTATHEEIKWYKEVAKRQLDISAPLIESYAGKLHALLIIKFIDNSHTIDELAYHNNNPKILTYIASSISIDREIFTETKRHYDRRQVDQYFLGKYVRRRQYASKFPYLQELLTRKRVKLNETSMMTPDSAIALVISNTALYKYLTPTSMGLTHGDLHCGNILAKDSELYFIDPNGSLKLPIEYDIGKIMHSIHGGYGSIMAGKYTLSTGFKDDYTLNIDIPTAYEEANSWLQRTLSEGEYIRGLYAESLHFATMLPHHASNERETLTIFLRCVQLFHNLFSLLAVRGQR